MSKSIKRVMCAGVMLLFALALVRAANFRFRQQEDAFRDTCRAELQKLGLTRDAAKTKYPTPEIAMVSTACLLPGGTGEVVVKGKFVPGSKFIFENDNIEVVKENLTATEYRATVKAAAGIGPQAAGLVVISPVTAITAQRGNAVKVGGKYEWTMESANGWKIVARSRNTQACGDSSSEQQPYEVAFYKKGEGTPFEKRDAELYFSLWEKTNYRFRVSSADAQAKAEQDDQQALIKKMMDPKLSNAERQKLTEQLQKAMQAKVAKMSDAAAIKQEAQKQEERRQQFGCEQIELEYPGGGRFTGQMRCSQKVGTRIALTGAVTTVK